MRHKVGQQGILERDLPAQCCSSIMPAGMQIRIVQQTSPNRVMIVVPLGAGVGWYHDVSPPDLSFHKVKASKIWFRADTVSEFNVEEFFQQQEEKNREVLAAWEQQKQACASRSG